MKKTQRDQFSNRDMGFSQGPIKEKILFAHYRKTWFVMVVAFLPKQFYNAKTHFLLKVLTGREVSLRGSLLLPIYSTLTVKWKCLPCNFLSLF